VRSDDIKISTEAKDAQRLNHLEITIVSIDLLEEIFKPAIMDVEKLESDRFGIDSVSDYTLTAKFPNRQAKS